MNKTQKKTARETVRSVWTAIKIPGFRDAIVCSVQGNDIGTICRSRHDAAWIICAGIGDKSRQVATSYNKREAMLILLTAPESFWR